MYTVEDLARATGFSVAQVRDRLRLLGPYLDGGLIRGERGKILANDRVVELLRAMREAERQGRGVREALTEALNQVEGPWAKPAEHCLNGQDPWATVGHRLEVLAWLLGVAVVLELVLIAVILLT